ncbi:MAG: metalloregulator ArsR/SmtB family transcription factor [Phycisphaera sp.]|nr:metalloregulator ArsR/SmtB family transcription factor [Phycisphaera sp.]
MNHMPATSPPMLSWMNALADATRARALRVLERAELTVAELCSVLQLPQSTVSRHLKVLADEGWAASRPEGTSRLYRMTLDELDPAAARLWRLLREQTAGTSPADEDDRRLERVLAQRQTRSEAFFSSAAGQWDKMRRELFGERFDLHAIAALLDPAWHVGDLGCGTARIAETVAPYVARVTAVDASAAMLKAAKKRLKDAGNVTLKRGQLEALPIDDATLDAAVIDLVLHHVADPGAVLAETARVLKPGGRVLVVDMLRHDRAEYQQHMGHVWLGFEQKQFDAWMTDAGLTDVRFHPLPVDADAKGPGLFTATAMKRNGRR